jgi:hypothetical protein
MRRFAWLLLAVLWVVWPVLARADGVIDDARVHMEAGQKLFEAGKFLDAATEFEAGFRVQPYKSFLYNAAVAAERGGDRVRAIAHYAEFLGAEPNAPDAAQIRATIERLQKEDQAAAPTRETEVQAIRSAVLVMSDPAGAPASVYAQTSKSAAPFDPKAKGDQAGWKLVSQSKKTPFDVPLEPGTYHIEIEPFKDYRRMSTELELKSGTLYVYNAGLSQGEFVGKVTVQSPVAGADVYLDDPTHKNAPIGATPFTFEAAPGEHVVSVVAPGYEELKKSVTVVQGKLETVQADLERVGYGYLLLDGDVDEMEIRIDGETQGTHHHADGPKKVRLSRGPHAVVIDASGMHAYRETIDVLGGQKLGVKAKLSELGGKGGAVGTIFLGLAAFGGGATLWILANDQDAETAQNFRYGAIGCFVGGGVFTALTVFLFAYDPTPRSTGTKTNPVDFDRGDVAPDAESPKKQADKKVSAMVPRVLTFSPLAAPTAAGLVVGGTF